MKTRIKLIKKETVLSIRFKAAVSKPCVPSSIHPSIECTCSKGILWSDFIFITHFSPQRSFNLFNYSITMIVDPSAAPENNADKTLLTCQQSAAQLE